MPTICIGNVAVGGTGKTPHTEYLIRILSEKYRVATLSRGYGRKTSGYLLAEPTSLATEIGDEPLQMKVKFPGTTVAVCESRVKGLQTLEILAPRPEVVLLDDAFQHLAVRCGIQIVLTDYARPYYTDFPMPAGNLREFGSAVREADAVIVTKCPENLTPREATEIEGKLGLRAGQRCFFTTLCYQNPTPLTSSAQNLNLTSGTKIFLLTGIAHPEHLYQYLSSQYSDIESFEFGDHHRFTRVEILALRKKIAAFSENAAMMTTDKDAARLRGTELWELLSDMPVFSIPVAVKFLWNEDGFISLVDNYISHR